MIVKARIMPIAMDKIELEFLIYSLIASDSSLYRRHSESISLFTRPAVC